MIGFKGEEEFRGRGVAYCATCDGEFFTGKEVFVIGGGFAAAEEAVFLTKYAKHVNILFRKDDFSCAAATAEAAKNHEKITVIPNTVVEEVYGDSALRGIRYKNIKTEEIHEYTATDGDNIGVFVFAGYQPATSLVKDVVELDEAGYIITDRVQKTNVDGIYAAGDVCIKPLRQVVTAVGDGALAATELEKYAAKMHKKTGIIPQQQKQETAKENPVNEVKAEKSKADANPQSASSSALFDEAMLAQLNAVFSRMENPLVLKLYLDSRPVSEELRGYMEELSKLTEKLSVDISKRSTEADPCVEVYRQDGSYTGLAFHGVPGGHEFTSFVLGLYNAAGAGQKIDEDVAEAVSAIDHRVDLKVRVSLSCTMCPDLVIAAQKLASLNENVTAEVYDLNHFPEIKDQYQVMSVPCLVINDGEKVTFGKKNIRQILELI